MKKIINAFILIAIFIISPLGCEDSTKDTYKPWKDDIDKPAFPKLEGTFIQDWLVGKWDYSRWDDEMRILKEAQMKYVILLPTMHGDTAEKYTTLYPSDLSFATHSGVDVVENCLAAAQKYGLKVFLGLNFHANWWKAANYPPEWLKKQMEYGNMLAKDLIKKYRPKYADTMYGWYWVWEINTNQWNNSYANKRLVDAMNINLDFLNKETPDMYVMISPFFQQRYSDINSDKIIWEYIISEAHFKPGDIFAPQDCVGAGGLTIDVLEEWFIMLKKIARAKPGLRFWGNTEIFKNHNDNQLYTATMDMVKKQMDIAYPLVDRLICFSYTHFYSPSLRIDLFHKTYLDYLQSAGSLSFQLPVETPTGLRIEEKTTDQAKLVWDEPNDRKNIVGYFVYKDNELIKDRQYDGEGLCHTYVLLEDLLPDVSHTYSVCSYNAIGETSGKTELEY